jgi:hypothetical protein
MQQSWFCHKLQKLGTKRRNAAQVIKEFLDEVRKQNLLRKSGLVIDISCVFDLVVLSKQNCVTYVGRRWYLSTKNNTGSTLDQKNDAGVPRTTDVSNNIHERC